MLYLAETHSLTNRDALRNVDCRDRRIDGKSVLSVVQYRSLIRNKHSNDLLCCCSIILNKYHSRKEHQDIESHLDCTRQNYVLSLDILNKQLLDISKVLVLPWIRSIFTWLDVVVVDCHVIISIRSTLFVMEPRGVQ